MLQSAQKLIALLLLMLFATGTWAQITDKKMTSGFRTTNGRKIDVLVIHSTFNNSGGDHYDTDKIIKQFVRYGVSAHYLIGRAGEIYRLVDEKNVAYHAGKSALPNGRTNLNSCSLGIELMCSYTDSVAEPQLQALITLTRDIQSRHKLNFILRHSDIAPARKTDPWNFNWNRYLVLLEDRSKR